MSTKICSKCKKEQDESDFNTKYGKLQSWCKSCNRQYQREHYLKNKDKYLAYLSTNRKKYKQTIFELLKEQASGGCVECGEKDFRVLDFDHIDQNTKSFNISHAFQNGYGIDRLKPELAKCQVLCANCHRKKTATQLGWYKKYKNNIHRTTNGQSPDFQSG